MKPQQQWIQSTTLTEVDLKGLVAEMVAAALDAQEVEKKAEKAKEYFQAGQQRNLCPVRPTGSQY